MAHRRKPKSARQSILRFLLAPPEPDAIADRRVVANLFACWKLTRCGREACDAAETCVGPGAPCFDENRENLRDALLDLADSPLFALPDDDF